MMKERWFLKIMENNHFEHNSFVLYKDSRVFIDRLDKEQRGDLLAAIFAYVCDGELPDFHNDGITQMCFDIIKNYLDRDEKKYQEKCQRNKENIQKRWSKVRKQSNTNVYSDKQSNTNATDKDNDTDNDTDKDNDTDNIYTVCPEPDKPTSEPSSILLPLNDKSFYDVPQDKIDLWVQTYQAVNVMQELQKMRAWLDSNPTRRKTRRGISRFINSWLSREQDSGKGNVQNSRQRHQNSQNNSFNDFQQNDYDFDELEKQILSN